MALDPRGNIAANVKDYRTSVPKLFAAGADVHARSIVRKQLENRGAVPEKMTAAEFAAFIDSELAKWGKVVKDANVKAE